MSGQGMPSSGSSGWMPCSRLGAYGSEQSDELLVVGPGVAAPERLAAAEQAAWILVGAHHSSGRLDFGNNLRGLLAETPCPVWVQPGPYGGVKRVLAASDLSPSSRPVLAAARDVAAAAGVPVEVLYVFARPDLGYVLGYPVPFPESEIERARETAEHDLASAARSIDWSGVSMTTRFIEADPASELVAVPQPGDVLVLGSHGHTALLGAILGSVTRRVLAETREPLVVVRA